MSSIGVPRQMSLGGDTLPTGLEGGANQSWPMANNLRAANGRFVANRARYKFRRRIRRCQALPPSCRAFASPFDKEHTRTQFAVMSRGQHVSTVPLRFVFPRGVPYVPRGQECCELFVIYSVDRMRTDAIGAKLWASPDRTRNGTYEPSLISPQRWLVGQFPMVEELVRNTR